VDMERRRHCYNCGNRHSLDARESVGQATSPTAILHPTGKLRAALIASNPVLVTRRADGTLGGVSVAVAQGFAAHLGVPIELKPYDNPARYNESLATMTGISRSLRATLRRGHHGW